MRLAAPLLAILLLAGCAAPSTTPTDEPPAGQTAGSGATPTTSGGGSSSTPASGASAAPCQSGEGDLFLMSSYSGDFLPAHMRPDLVEIARDGTIRVLQGHTDPGPGEMSAEEGALDGLTLDEARAMLERRNFTYETEHLVISRGDEAVLPPATFASFCQSLTSALPTLRDEYPHGPDCEYALVLTWDVSTASGERTIAMSDCAEHAEEFETVKRDFQRLIGPG